MIQKRYGYFLLLWLLNLMAGMAQTTYPVQVNVHVLPPYSLYLSDYYSGTRERLTVTLINRDQLKPTVNVRLRMIITAPGGIRLQTNDNVRMEPLPVDAGMPVRLTQEDLAPYFLPSNLITQGYLTAGKLPEGMVEFCFQAVEAYTGQVLSTSMCTRAWITSQKPPLLSLPRNNESIVFRDPLNVMFQWTPLHQGLAQVEYDFILKELWDNGMTAQAAFAYSPEIYRETTRSTSIIYGPMQPPLIAGKRYAWCVQAKAREGMDEVNVFQNDGYSEIRTFILQDNCVPPEYVQATAERKRINLEWGTLPEYIGFTVSYRVKAADGKTPGQWKEQQSQEPKAILYGLESGATYEYRVASSCIAGQPVYSPIFSIAVPAVDSARLAQCGILPNVNLTNQEPIKELKPGDEFKAGDFPITMISVSGSGTFTGEGWTIIPWLNDAKVAVEFKSITINTDRQMIEGFVEAKYDKNEGQIANLDDVFEGGFDVGNVKTGLTKIDYKFDFTIPGVEAFALNDQGDLVITDSDNVPHVVTPQDKEGQGNEGNKVVVFPMTVQDKNGDVYQVEKVTQTGPDGKPKEVAKATKLARVGQPLAEGSFDPTQLNGDKAIVTFEKGAGVYAFDTWEDYYGKISLIEDKYKKLYTNYYAPWKLLPAGKTDKVSAKIEIKDNSIKPEQVKFITPQGTEYTAEYANGVYNMQLTAGPANDVQELYALYPKGDGKYYTLGKLGIATYAAQTQEVVLVAVNDVPVNKSEIERTLKEIYGVVGVTWTVSKDTFNYKDNARLMDGATGLSTYNEAMEDLNSTYRAARPSFNTNANYLFFLKATGNTSVNNRDFTGFMPRGGQFGYIFTSEIPDANESITVAHELGHGRWKLYHPFDKHYGGFEEAKKTDNLMAYGNGKHLAKWQWDQMNDPAMLVSIFEGDDRSAITKDFKHYLFEILNQYWCALDQKKNAFNYYCFEHGDIRGLTSVDELKAFDVVRSVGIKYATPGVYDFNTTYTLKTLTGRGNNFHIIFTGNSGTEITIFFVRGEDRDKFISGVLTKPNAGWSFHYSKLMPKLDQAIKDKKYSDIPPLLLTLPRCGLENMSATTRVEVIKSLVNEAWTDDHEEVIILKLINEIKDEKVPVTDLVTELRKLDWMEFLDAVDGEESDGLGLALALLAEKYYKYLKKEEIKSIGYVNYKELRIYHVYSRYKFDQKNGKIRTYIGTDAPVYGSGGFHGEDAVVPYTDPFAPFLLGKENKDLASDQLPRIPYILLVKKIKKDESDRAFDQAMVLVDIASLFVGIGELKLALKTPGAIAKLSRLILGGADMLSTATSIYCAGDAKDPLCLQWKKYEMYVQLGLVGASTWDLFKATYNESDELVSFLKKYSEHANISKIKTKEFIAKLDELKLDDAALKSLDADLINPALIDLFTKNPKMLEAWQALKRAGLPANDVKAIAKEMEILAKGVKLFKVVKKVPLNSEYLGKKAMDYRKKMSMWHDGNVVVFEYVDNSGKVQHLVQSTLQSTSKHSERLAIEALEREGIPLKNVKKIYSELDLCSLESGGTGVGGCKKMVTDKIGTDIEVYFSYDYPGVGPDQAAKAIREASINQRSIDFNQFK